MNHFKRRTEWTSALFLRLAAFYLSVLLLAGLLPAAGAVEEMSGQAPDEMPEQVEILSAVEALLRSYQEEAMLYEARDLRSGTAADPSLVDNGQTFHVRDEGLTLAQLGDNLIFLEKKAAFYAMMRQIQGIYREDLQLFYDFGDPEITENVCRVSVKETEQFRYTDSDRLSVNETYYTVRLVKPEDRWIIADVTDGSRFDTFYKEQGAAFDENAALAEFAAALERDGCTVSYTAPPSGEGVLPYNGANAAAYAYTYSRLAAGTPRSGFYNSQFYRYDGQGGDCQNFASQCIWAGFGGSQTGSAIRRGALPMDASGSDQWFGRAASGGKINHSWISCRSFRKYLTGNEDGTGIEGSNASGETGMYATILDVASASALTGASPEELVGAVAHVEGSGGSYSHAIVLTEATGNRRSEIWFCGHTKDVTHIKLGDYYIWPMKVYIPRGLRTGGTTSGGIQVDRLQPVEAGSSGVLSVRCGEAREKLVINVTPPDGTQVRAATSYGMDRCEVEYLFDEPGLYEVECAVKGAEWTVETYFVRCYAPLVPETDAAPEEIPVEETLPEEWETPPEEVPGEEAA